MTLAQAEYNLNFERMSHKVSDTFEIQEFKRLWHQLHNSLRVYPFFDDDENATKLLTDLVSTVYALNHGRKALAPKQS